MTIPMDSSKILRIFKNETFINVSTIIICSVFLFGDMRRIEGKIDQQSARTDKLYELYVSSQKDYNDKFYELLKEVNVNGRD